MRSEELFYVSRLRMKLNIMKLIQMVEVTSLLTYCGCMTGYQSTLVCPHLLALVAPHFVPS